MLPCETCAHGRNITEGHIRVNVKTSAKDEVMDKIEQQKRCGQLVFGDYVQCKNVSATKYKGS
jgi:hypothetical protein